MALPTYPLVTACSTVRQIQAELELMDYKRGSPVSPPLPTLLRRIDINDLLSTPCRVCHRTLSDIKVRQVKGRVTHEQNKTDSN